MWDLEKVVVEDMLMGYGMIFVAVAMFTSTLFGVEAVVSKIDLVKVVVIMINFLNVFLLFLFVWFVWVILVFDFGLSEVEEVIKESLKNDAFEVIDLVLKIGVF